jgi:lysine 2,3-aminomutase
MSTEIQQREVQSAPPSPWNELQKDEWSDWRWQLANRLNTIEDLGQVIQLTDSEKNALHKQDLFRVDITPYFASLIDPDDPNCPIRMQVIPQESELLPESYLMADSLGEENQSPVPGLVHRYPDRVLMLVTTQCASYCRYCTRSRIVGKAEANFSTTDFERQIDYIENTPQVRDVLLSGGDPLMLPRKILEKVMNRLHSIPHVEIVRINSRIPIFLPQRITDDYVEFLRQFAPLWLNVHVNHPKEITQEVEIALNKMADAGIVLGSQTVLLAGINDCPNIILDLVHKLVMNRVRPYYLYQCDLVKGAGHFRTPVAKGIEIIESLRGHTSGYAIPTFAVDMPSGGGKVPLQPNYLLNTSDEKVVLRNYEGHIGAYTQPRDYQPHTSETCSYCKNSKRASKPNGTFEFVSS